MKYQQIGFDVSEHVATVTLNRPEKLNAWTPTMEHEVQAALLEADGDAQVRVIVLTGAGRGFCAGADMQSLDQVAGAGRSPEELRQVMLSWPHGPKIAGSRDDFQKTYSYFPAIAKPVLAAVNGPAVGLGLVLALYCDVRFASDQARFGTAFARRGLIAEHGISWMLPRLVGLASAFDLLYSARVIDASEALRIGLVSRIIPHENLMGEVRAYAEELATAVSPRSLRVMKRQVYNALFQTLSEAIDTANEEMFQSFLSADFREGVAHFLEKRPAAFTGE
jgi:enoyl-CoA hydratase/carnithine racemase